MEDYRTKCIELLESRGVTVDDIADCARFLHADDHVDLKKEELLGSVMSVLSKREVQNAIMTGIELDLAAEKKQMNDKDLQAILTRDEGLYGVDEVLARFLLFTRKLINEDFPTFDLPAIATSLIP